MSYHSQIDVSVVELDFDFDDEEDCEPVLDALRKCIAEPDRWYGVDWYRKLLSGEDQRCSNYDAVVEPVLVELSVQFPDMILYVRGWGQDIDDVWLRRYQGGRVAIRELKKKWEMERPGI